MAYIYRHTRLDTGHVFYVGIGGLSKDDNYKRAYSKKDRNNYWNNIVKITHFKIDIISDGWISIEEAYEKEKFWISFYGRSDLGKGSLCNFTDGGEGNSNPTKETRKKISESNKNRIPTQNQKDSSKIRLLGKSYIELYGLEKANFIKEKQKLAVRPPYKSGENHHMFGKKRPLQSKIMKNLYSEGKISSPFSKFKGDLNPMKNSEICKKVSESKKGIPKSKIECPHCHKIGGTGNMQRWHFNNCKKIISNLED